MVVWDETHRNGQLDQIPWLIRRDRNHPSVGEFKLGKHAAVRKRR
jgi:hypothetical protein